MRRKRKIRKWWLKWVVTASMVVLNKLVDALLAFLVEKALSKILN